MKIALASPPFPSWLDNGLQILENMVREAAAQQAIIVCFPESFLPGYPGMGYAPEDREASALESALKKACAIAAEYSIAIVLPMDRFIGDKIYNVACVISKTGELLGQQTKNQLDPTEDELWSAGTQRNIFEVDGLKFGITICHEGFRYPESVRWAAQQGAHIVFHPHFSGSNATGPVLTEFAAKENPYYEKAMMMRALENTIYFASCNYASQYPESASAIIAPDGRCIAHAPYGRVGVLVMDIDPTIATGLLAKRFKNELYNSSKAIEVY
ncbi:MAG TPA: carbon-nitrogen hydrolase family protein [Chitinophagaceae bacterium]|jgi:predicted amidohydrolase|nr:carbon-nitrogen hydrolase family protein [Chitinophagaceae bacterium]